MEFAARKPRKLCRPALNCKLTMIVMNSGSQLSEMSTISNKLTSQFMRLSWFLSLSLVFGQVISPHHSDQMSHRSQFSWMALWRCSLSVFAFVIIFVFVFVFVNAFVIVFFGQVMSPHHSDQMIQMSQVSSIAFWKCSLHVLSLSLSLYLPLSLSMIQKSQVSSIVFWKYSLHVFVIVIVFVFAFVIVFLLVSSYLLIILIKCCKDHKSLGVL